MKSQIIAKTLKIRVLHDAFHGELIELSGEFFEIGGKEVPLRIEMGKKRFEDAYDVWQNKNNADQTKKN
jgi:prolyl-tRNA synthetase